MASSLLRSSSSSSSPWRLLPLLLSFAAIQLSGCDQGTDGISGGLTLVQVQVVTRHGARTRLSKDAATMAEGGAALTSFGEEQARDLGLQLRDAYLRSSDNGISVGSTEGGLGWVVSSDLDRTIATAMAMSAAALSDSSSSSSSLRIPSQPSTLVPVHTIPERDDITIRAYKACPRFQDDLQALHNSEQFVERRVAHAPLLVALAEAFPDLAEPQGPAEQDKGASASSSMVPLEHLWNVYDAVSVRAEAEGTITDASDAAAAAAFGLTEPQWIEAASLAAWVEHQRYGRDVAGARLGSNLWEEILSRAESLYAFGSSGNSNSSSPSSSSSSSPSSSSSSGPHYGDIKPPHRYVHYSAHYPTLLSLLAALDLFAANEALLNPEAMGIPGYASALVVEVWERPRQQQQHRGPADDDDGGGDSGIALRLRFKDGHGGASSPPPALDAAPYLNMGPSCAAASASWGLPDPSSYCPLRALKATISSDPLWAPGAAQWCQQCGNIEAAPCVEAAAAAAAGDASVRSWVYFAAGALLGAALASAVVSAAAVCIVRRMSSRRRDRLPEEGEANMENPIMEPKAEGSAALEISFSNEGR